ncbi:MAG TPA: DUF4430 domain-containing protein [Candidatus Thermoplasmatota archaeon]|nr:DUF4430 domain-containing protein [Candidatus Thermoplasmatota archaeon]
MRTTRLVTLALAALVLLPALPAAGADAPVTVTLQVAGGHPAAPGWRDCDVSVPASANVGAVLDAAVASGCILEWSYESSSGWGRYITSIDHVAALLPTYWAFYIDGEYASTGIDSTTVSEGATYRFVYEQWLLPL